jgi:hypothetical protein
MNYFIFFYVIPMIVCAIAYILEWKEKGATLKVLLAGTFVTFVPIFNLVIGLGLTVFLLITRSQEFIDSFGNKQIIKPWAKIKQKENQ